MHTRLTGNRDQPADVYGTIMFGPCTRLPNREHLFVVFANRTQALCDKTNPCMLLTGCLCSSEASGGVHSCRQGGCCGSIVAKLLGAQGQGEANDGEVVLLVGCACKLSLVECGDGLVVGAALWAGMMAAGCSVHVSA